jgi:predicted Zn-ribbon and HTH transcriptional regulator
MADSGLGNGLFQAFIDWIYSSGDISVPSNYHQRCIKVQEMLDNDISGSINSILDYAINSASEAKYRVECSETTLQKLLNLWLEDINIEIKGIPTGLQALSKEYFKERWEGSSFCILRVKDWQKITADNVTIEVPTTMWFVNGGSIYVARPKDKNYTLGSDKYYLDEAQSVEIPSEDEKIIVQKPYNRWFDQYSTPYLIRKGIYKNWLGMKTLQDKSDEVISKILPYLFVISKGTENLFLQGDVNYSDTELKDLTENFKTEIEKYRNQKGKIPTNTIPFDTKYDHLIPDLRKILTEELYRQGYRSILAGLGFIDMLEITPSRQESRMNPKVFVSEINEGVVGFKSILLEAIYLIEERNKNAHKKLFSDKGKIFIVNSPLRINVEQILDSLRSGFDRGVSSIESYQEILGLDPTTEKERRKKELQNGDEDLFYPHLIQNQEAVPDRMGVPTKIKDNTKLEDQNKKKNTPETKTKTAELEMTQIAKCKKCGHEFDYLSVQEAGMGYVKCPKCEEAVTQEDLIIAPYDIDNPPSFLKKYPVGAIDVFITVFNESYPKGEDYAFPVAWTALKRWMKKHGYHKEGEKWVKSEEIK